VLIEWEDAARRDPRRRRSLLRRDASSLGDPRGAGLAARASDRL